LKDIYLQLQNVNLNNKTVSFNFYDVGVKPFCPNEFKLH
jgi:hypothetical protein